MGQGVDFLSVLMGLGAIWTVVILVDRWRAFWGGDLDRRDQQLAAAIALFLVIPIGVLLHELGHAAATWWFDGEVVNFQWEIYSGSVTPVGLFTELEGWWITVAGNLVSVVLGLVLLTFAYFGARLRRPLRYVLLVAAVLQLLFALIGYPLLSLSDSFGETDWRDIYDFSATPTASAITAAVHAALLAGLWLCRGRLEDVGASLTSGG